MPKGKLEACIAHLKKDRDTVKTQQVIVDLELSGIKETKKEVVVSIHYIVAKEHLHESTQAEQSDEVTSIQQEFTNLSQMLPTNLQQAQTNILGAVAAPPPPPPPKHEELALKKFAPPTVKLPSQILNALILEKICSSNDYKRKLQEAKNDEVKNSERKGYQFKRNTELRDHAGGFLRGAKVQELREKKEKERKEEETKPRHYRITIDWLNEERCDLWKNYALLQKDYENLENNKNDLFEENETHKRSVKLLNNKVVRNDALRNQPQDVVKLHEEINILKATFAKFFKGTDCLDKLLRYKRSLVNKSSHGYRGKKFVHGVFVIVFYLYGKVGHKTCKCKDLPKRSTPNVYNNNKRGPKKIWVPNEKIILVANVLDKRKKLLSWYQDNGCSHFMIRKRSMSQCLTLKHSGTTTS
ncbi:hypothetical protein JHK87_050071 [Glycine soja]|nr:hypothetical protein JHK87_050071 [Glycine soja]